MDSSGECAAVTVFNFADRFGFLLGDAVAIPEPFVSDVCATFKDQVKSSNWQLSIFEHFFRIC